MDTIRKAFVLTHSLVLVLGIAALCLALQAGDDNLRELLQFQREGLARGELWRMFTGHVVHLGWSHALMNLFALFLVVYLLGDGIGPARILGLLLASLLAVDAGLWFLRPELQWYVGLSGLLHGLFAGLLLLQWFCRGERYLWLILLLSVKLGWEGLAGSLPMTAELAGGPVVTAAHLYGTLGGVLCGILMIFVRYLTKGVTNNTDSSVNR